MDRLESQPATVAGAVVIYTPKNASDHSLCERMSTLLERAAEQTLEQAEQALFHQIIDELVPDEARIIGALSEGAVYPLLHIGMGPKVGPTTRRIAENFSTIGKPAGVKLLEQVPAYITHLRALGILESGPEDKSLEIKYQILEGEGAVKRVVEDTPRGAGSSIRYLRRSLRMSNFGQKFWQACRLG
ncbi:MAG TPA: Abi-alpha family protein [Solimonas sp.]